MTDNLSRVNESSGDCLEGRDRRDFYVNSATKRIPRRGVLEDGQIRRSILEIITRTRRGGEGGRWRHDDKRRDLIMNVGRRSVEHRVAQSVCGSRGSRKLVCEVDSSRRSSNPRQHASDIIERGNERAKRRQASIMLFGGHL